MSSFHPDAKARIDARADEVLATAAADRTAAVDVDAGPSFAPAKPISGHITDKDIIGPIRRWQTDGDGNEIGCSAATTDSIVEFIGPRYEAFSSLVQLIGRTRVMRESVSEGTVKNWILDWALLRSAQTEVSCLSDFLLQQRSTAVGDFRTVVPLHEPYIEAAFQLGDTLLRPLSQEELETWFPLPSSISGDSRTRADERVTGRRRHLQSRTVIDVNVQAERSFATTVALERASVAASVIRLASKGMFFPTVRSNCVPLGFEVTERYHAIQFHSGELLGMSEGIVDPESTDHWALDRRTIAHDLRYWTMVMDLVEKDQGSEFRRELLDAILLYSRVALSRDVSEKLVHLFAALESILLRNDSEPIQAAIGERLAFVVGATADARAHIARLVRTVYALRSKFIHHGVTASDRKDLTSIKALMMEVWKLFFQLTTARDQFPTRAALLDEIERRKWQ